VTSVYFLKSKNEAAGRFQKYKAAVEKVFSNKEKAFKIKVIRTEGASEYSSRKFHRELKRSGIEWQVTVPYTSQENGVPENSNRVLVERANALIQHAGAPKSYWAEALQVTVYLNNVSLTNGIRRVDAIPHQLWLGWKPDSKPQRVWGCTGYFLIHQAKCPGKKWGPIMEKRFFIGYTHTIKQ